MPAPKYDVHPGVAMMRKWAAELPTKTGRTLQQWAELVLESGIEDRKDRVEWLKKTHKFGTIAAWHIAEYAADSHSWDGDPALYLKQAAAHVEAMFSGPIAALRPILDKLMTKARALGKDVKICPCKTIVPFYRERVFAEVKPATRTRVELSFALGAEPFTGRLKANPRAKGNDRLRHQIALATVADIDAEVLGWLTAAYEADA
jgi:hypothetical protein